jgi:hypothetical protein
VTGRFPDKGAAGKTNETLLRTFWRRFGDGPTVIVAAVSIPAPDGELGRLQKSKTGWELGIARPWFEKKKERTAYR